MSRIVNVTLAGPGSFALTRVIQQALLEAGYSVNAGHTALDVIVPTRGCHPIEIDKPAGELALEVKVDASDAIAALDAVEIAMAVLNAPHSSSAAIDKANAVLLAAMTPVLTLDTTCNDDAVKFVEPAATSLLGRLRRLANRIRLDPHDLSRETYQLAYDLGHADQYRGGALPPTTQVLAQKMATLCGSGKNSPELYDIAGQFLGATGGAYRG